MNPNELELADFHHVSSCLRPGHPSTLSSKPPVTRWRRQYVHSPMCVDALDMIHVVGKIYNMRNTWKHGDTLAGQPTQKHMGYRVLHALARHFL